MDSKPTQNVTWEDCKKLGYTYNARVVTLIGDAYAPNGACIAKGLPVYLLKVRCIQHALAAQRGTT